MLKNIAGETSKARAPLQDSCALRWRAEHHPPSTAQRSIHRCRNRIIVCVDTQTGLWLCANQTQVTVNGQDQCPLNTRQGNRQTKLPPVFPAYPAINSTQWQGMDTRLTIHKSPFGPNTTCDIYLEMCTLLWKAVVCGTVHVNCFDGGFVYKQGLFIHLTCKQTQTNTAYATAGHSRTRNSYKLCYFVFSFVCLFAWWFIIMLKHRSIQLWPLIRKKCLKYSWLSSLSEKWWRKA